MESSLSQYLQSNLKITPEKANSLTEACNSKEYKKGEILLGQDEFCTHTFFIEKGLLRQYYLNEIGKEHTLLFASENWFVSDRESVYFKRPSRYVIEALEITRVRLIDEDFLQKLSVLISDFSEFNSRLLHNHIRHLQKRIESLLSVDAESRYIDFIKKYPEMHPRIPQALLASYLGITPESLSRIRSKIAQGK